MNDVLGIWIDHAEGAKFWLKICNELATRGVEDVIFVCVDGLKGLPEAIESVWPNAIVRTCVVHLVRASTRFVSYTDRKTVCAGLQEIYHAPNEEAALAALEKFEERWGERYPAIGALWREAWDRFVPMPATAATSQPTTPCSNCSTSASERARQERTPRTPRTHSHGWKAALNRFEVCFPGRLDIT